MRFLIILVELLIRTLMQGSDIVVCKGRQIRIDTGNNRDTNVGTGIGNTFQVGKDIQEENTILCGAKSQAKTDQMIVVQFIDHIIHDIL